MTIVEFLRARLEEDADDARRRLADDSQFGMWELDPERTLREVEAKRRMLDEYEQSVRAVGHGLSRALYRVVFGFVEVHADHPDYDEAWRP
jgi:hypothetical protein